MCDSASHTRAAIIISGADSKPVIDTVLLALSIILGPFSTITLQGGPIIVLVTTLFGPSTLFVFFFDTPF